MIKSKTLRFGFLAVVLLILAASAFAFHFGSAHAASPSATASTATVHVSILRLKGGVQFGKTTLTVTHGVAFTILNRTITSQSVTSGGKTIMSIAAKSSHTYTFAKAGTYTLGLASNSAATCTVTVV